ncbi:lysylphosphatidylglycerol synthase transmembrane domain-containing protein [Oribacterium sp. P6A1]|uniref:lysylphosphatidylglycerol synthase transmembrane domain-containing protein n=1 Tax=Oribacterium sp. P6A1 TaxID=1410612 RepID=UPI0005644F7C|nr:lysylphosphatidylglycerol synthase transmembrane domain-containing protein [Oribacterium sp. P6A1]
MNVKKNIFFAMGAVLIAYLTLRTVSSQSKALTPEHLMLMLEHASIPGLISAFLSMFGFILFEGLALQCLLNSLGYKTNLLKGLLYSAGDQFFSAITPSASGGQPVSALFMRFNRIPVSAITVTLLANLVMYTLSSFSIGLVSIIFMPDVLGNFDEISLAFILFGSLVMLTLTVIFYALLVKSSYLKRIGLNTIKFLHKIHIIKDVTRWNDRMERHMADFKLCSQMLHNKGSVLLLAFIFNLAQRISQISITPLMHLALGNLESVNLARLWIIQNLAQVGSNCVPIPGGMGVADYLMLDGFQSVFTKDYAYMLQTLCRSISFYICSSISGLIVLVGYIKQIIKSNKEFLKK